MNILNCFKLGENIFADSLINSLLIAIVVTLVAVFLPQLVNSSSGKAMYYLFRLEAQVYRFSCSGWNQFYWTIIHWKNYNVKVHHCIVIYLPRVHSLRTLCAGLVIQIQFDHWHIDFSYLLSGTCVYVFMCRWNH